MQKQTNQQFVLQSTSSSAISLDCIKVCPLNDQLWAFSYYQQMPEFQGGIQVLDSSQLDKISSKILNLGPIMHIQWLPASKQFPKNANQYKIVAANRQNKISICQYNTQNKQLSQIHNIILDQNIFCLYCGWSYSLYKNLIQIVVSTNQSTVYHLQYNFQQNKQPEEVFRYQKHQYAVWACRLSLCAKYLITGDEVNTLYLYELENKQLIGTNKTAHEQGICEIINYRNNCQENINNFILTGGFDGTIAMIDITNFGTTINKFHLGGTIWRIIPSRVNQRMYNNSWLICNSSNNIFQLFSPQQPQQARIKWDSKSHHQSLAYAADWNKDIMITVSYYDKKINIWKQTQQ